MHKATARAKLPENIHLQPGLSAFCEAFNFNLAFPEANLLKKGGQISKLIENRSHKVHFLFFLMQEATVLQQ